MRRLAPLVLLAALAGCQQLGPTPGDAEELGREYLRAALARDWAAVCATRTRLERHRLDEEGGCEQTFRSILEPGLDRLRGAKIGAVRVQGELAGIDVIGADGERITTLGAIIDQEQWRLHNAPPGMTP